MLQYNYTTLPPLPSSECASTINKVNGSSHRQNADNHTDYERDGPCFVHWCLSSGGSLSRPSTAGFCGAQGRSEALPLRCYFALHRAERLIARWHVCLCVLDSMCPVSLVCSAIPPALCPVSVLLYPHCCGRRFECPTAASSAKEMTRYNSLLPGAVVHRPVTAVRHAYSTAIIGVVKFLG